MKSIKQLREAASNLTKKKEMRILKVKGFVQKGFVPNENNKPTKKV